MQNKMILGLLVSFFILWQPINISGADKHVADCLDDNADCEEETEETDETNEIDETDSEKTPEHLIADKTMDSGSLALNIVKMVVALLFILALIYALLWLLKKRRSYDQVGVLENIGGISIGQHKSVQIVRIGSKMYLLGVGNNVEMLKELSEEEVETIKRDKEQSPSLPAASFLQSLSKKWGTRNNTAPKNEANDFNASFQKELDKLKANRHQLMDQYEQKEDGHD